MKLILNTILCLMLTVNLMAQDNAVDIKDPKAKVILDKISTQLASYENVEMDFELSISFPGQEAEVQKGKIIQSGNKYFVDMKMQSVYSDGESLWLHMKSNNEVQWNNAEAAAEGGFMDPSSLLNLYKTGDFAYAITGEQTEDNVAVQQIEFKSLDRNSEYSKMRLTVVKGKNEVKRMKVFGKDGSAYTMKLNDLKANQELPDETFVFDKSKFPGVHVEDLRMD